MISFLIFIVMFVAGCVSYICETIRHFFGCQGCAWESGKAKNHDQPTATSNVFVVKRKGDVQVLFSILFFLNRIYRCLFKDIVCFNKTWGNYSLTICLIFASIGEVDPSHTDQLVRKICTCLLHLLTPSFSFDRFVSSIVSAFGSHVVQLPCTGLSPAPLLFLTHPRLYN